MLSPCKTKEKQFVVVELCDDIRIDTVQLANYEFFSGVFKDFSVSVAKTNTNSEGWTHATTYRAKNIRGVQVSVLRFTFQLSTDPCVVVPVPCRSQGFLSIHPNRISFPLFQRILLPAVPASRLRPNPFGGMEMGHVDGGK